MALYKHIDIPDVIRIEIDGCAFLFERPSNLDFFDLAEVKTKRDEIMFVLSRLKKIEGLDLKKQNYKDLNVQVQLELYTKYMEVFTKYHTLSDSTDPKKNEELS